MIFTFIFLVGCLAPKSVSCGGCEVVPPLNDNSPSIGLVFVPGATIPGENYIPLMEAVQARYPGSLWVAATTQWAGEMPNPLEIGGQLSGCRDMADQMGLDTSNVFFAGHSLGGVVLESFVSGHAELTQGIILLGTWLPDLLARANNQYPVPVLTAIGELDGGGLSYLRREVEETAALSAAETSLAKTILVPQVNHAQVASGSVEQSVVDNDIDGELSEEEAHDNYGLRVADWLSINALSLGLLTQDQAEQSLTNMAEYEAATAEFLEPFVAMYEMEQVGFVSPHVVEAQRQILALENSDDIEIVDSILTNTLTFQSFSPSAEQMDNGTTFVHTYSHLTYDLDPLDFNNHLSAKTLKAKMKLADYVYDLLGLERRGEVLSCAQINANTLELAKTVASPAALQRLTERGRTLVFAPDDDKTWGLGFWELSSLQWTEKEGNNVELTASRLWSEPDFPLYPGEHYCDLLSPYRALEWIYIESIRHKMQF